MIICKSFDDIERDNNSFVTIGTFDGIHLAHQEIIKSVVSESKLKKGRSVVTTFDPHPRLIVDTTNKIHLLTTLEEKEEILNKLGVDVLFIVNFDKKISRLTPYEFFTKLIYDTIGVRELVVGHDHSFGKDRMGNIEILKSLGQHLNFNVKVIEPISIDNIRISSTIIRNAIASGNLEDATRQLGRYYSLTGKIIEGDRRGSEIGFPTANIDPVNGNKIIPKLGVYLVRVHYKDNEYFGMMNIGKRPTFSTSEKIFFEVNIFDFKENIYHQELKVEFIKYIREEQKFNFIEKLIEQMNSDKQECHKYIRNNLTQ